MGTPERMDVESKLCCFSSWAFLYEMSSKLASLLSGEGNRCSFQDVMFGNIALMNSVQKE